MKKLIIAVILLVATFMFVGCDEAPITTTNDYEAQISSLEQRIADLEQITTTTTEEITTAEPQIIYVEVPTIVYVSEDGYTTDQVKEIIEELLITWKSVDEQERYGMFYDEDDQILYLYQYDSEGELVNIITLTFDGIIEEVLGEAQNERV